MVCVPPVPAIDEVSLTHAEAEVALVLHEAAQDSSQALSVVAHMVSAQKRMLPKFEDSYAE
jgi:hypothetical protein